MDFLELEKNEMKGYLPELEIPEGFVIAGGSIRRWFLGEKQESDFDYFRVDDKKDWELPIKGLKETYSNRVQTTYKLKGKIIQAIKRPYSSVNGLFRQFDFHHCQFAYTGDEIFTTKKAIISSTRKHLSLNTIIEDFELDTLRRAFKYQRQGFTPCEGTIADIAIKLKNSDSDFEKQKTMSPGGGKKSIIKFD